MFKDYIKGKKAACFDLDGTIVDSLPYWNEAVNETFKKIGVELSEGTFDVYRGHSLLDMYKSFFKYYKPKTNATPEQLVQETDIQFLNIISKIEELEPREGFWALAEELKVEKGFKLGLTSNSNRKIVDKLMEKLGIAPVFDITIAGDEVTYRKPNPEIYHKAAKGLETNVGEVLVFEDSTAGAEAAVKAGMDVIIIWNVDIKESDYPRESLAFLSDFSSLPGYLDLDYMEYLKKMVEEPDPYINPNSLQ